MGTPDALYDMCRRYVSDEATTLGPLKDRILGYLRSRNLKALCECSSLIDWQSTTVDMVRVLMQIEAFFKKNAAFSVDSVCREAALATFVENEAQCRDTNHRLDNYYLGSDHLDPEIQVLISRAESYISRVLGPFHTFLRDLPNHVSLTNGATLNTSRSKSQAYRKVRLGLDCTPRAVPYLRAFRRLLGYGTGRDKVQLWNRIEVVPKNWKTGRTIGCEPEGNIPFQLAFDSFGKSRLKKFGQDLSDQSRNQRLAHQGSVDGSFATIDLRSASGTVAFNTVAWLFPSDWFNYLRDFRSPKYRGALEGRYEQFSSMGNGSTFVIETLIFAAFSYAVGSRKFSIYGDDIAIETEFVEPLLRILNFFGFTINTEKSFTTGPFRESCGGNYFNGVNVTPVYVRDIPRCKSEWCHLVNSVAAVTKPYGQVWVMLRALREEHRLPLVPVVSSTGAGVWVDPQTAYTKKLIRYDGWVVKYKALVSKAEVKTVRNHQTYFLWCLDATQGRSRNATFSWKRFHESEEDVERSKVPLLSHKYVRKWVRWFPPASAASITLYAWSDFLLANARKKR